MRCEAELGASCDSFLRVCCCRSGVFRDEVLWTAQAGHPLSMCTSLSLQLRAQSLMQ